MNSLLEFKRELRELLTRPDAGAAPLLAPLFEAGVTDDIVNDSWCGIAWEIAAGSRRGAPPPQLADCWLDVQEIVQMLVAHHNEDPSTSFPIDGADLLDCLRAILFRPTR